jgi:D-beta-D-heptose 7-phosphate kinase/D-beta-D-heptose 1-phosphate adenosyltransferase
LRVNTVATIGKKVAQFRERKYSVGFTNGVFDLLHVGHVGTLEYAKRHCSKLVVGIDDDESVRALKGPTRPVNPAMERALMVGALRAVDAVVVFDAAWLDRLVESIKPDILVKGAEYADREIVGARHAGIVLFAPMVADRSTTKALEGLCGLSSPAGRASSGRTSSPTSRGAA